MEALAIIPFILMMIVYLGFLGFIIWVAVSFIKTQKERNVILREISYKLDKLDMTKKEE
ncbi:hypothetical protein R4Z09_16455 [Niallia oryzisoli]|uniref:ATP synthase F0 subunit 8 n=1 Tax=Niallia oryzisoli TaxID=1737571 RepID=A0ABZ2C692_9BACI